MENRRKWLTDLDKLIGNVEERTESLLTELEWTKEAVLKKGPNALNSTKQQSKVQKNEELPFPESIIGRSSVVFTKEKQAHIILEAFTRDPSTKIGVDFDSILDRDVPNSYAEEQVNFTTDERLALYQHVIDESGHFEEPEIRIPITNDEDQKERRMTMAEYLALQRDLKRRRMKYRVAKEPPLSYTEEIRNLLATQMDAFTKHLKKEEETDSRERSRHKERKRKRSRSRSRHRSSRPEKKHKKSHKSSKTPSHRRDR